MITQWRAQSSARRVVSPEKTVPALATITEGETEQRGRLETCSPPGGLSLILLPGGPRQACPWGETAGRDSPARPGRLCRGPRVVAPGAPRTPLPVLLSDATSSPAVAAHPNHTPQPSSWPPVPGSGPRDVSWWRRWHTGLGAARGAGRSSRGDGAPGPGPPRLGTGPPCLGRVCGEADAPGRARPRVLVSHAQLWSREGRCPATWGVSNRKRRRKQTEEGGRRERVGAADWGKASKSLQLK